MLGRTYVTPEMQAAEEMCFAISFCDSLLISSSTSTYGFWIGYMMRLHDEHRGNMAATGKGYINRKRRSIFYNANTDFYSAENFPTDWISIAA